MELVASGTMAVGAGESPNVLAGKTSPYIGIPVDVEEVVIHGVYVLELDLTDMGAGDSAWLYVQQISGTGTASGAADVDFTNAQTPPKYTSAPFICASDSGLNFEFGNTSAGALSVPWKLFRLSPAARVDLHEDASKETSDTYTVTISAIGVYALVIEQALVGADNFQIDFKTDNVVTKTVTYTGAQATPILTVDPVLASSTGVKVDFTFTALTGAQYFSASLFRVP